MVYSNNVDWDELVRLYEGLSVNQTIEEEEWQQLIANVFDPLLTKMWSRVKFQKNALHSLFASMCRMQIVGGQLWGRVLDSYTYIKSQTLER